MIIFTMENAKDNTINLSAVSGAEICQTLKENQNNILELFKLLYEWDKKQKVERYEYLQNK